MCPQCGAATWPVDRSLHADSSNQRRSYQKAALEELETLVGGYTQDYVLRRRTCRECGKQEWFGEVSLADLKAVIAMHVKDHQLEPERDTRTEQNTERTT